VRQCYFAAIYWLRKASLALEVESPDFKSPSFLSRSLMITKSALCMSVDKVGFSAIPEALFWYDIYSSIMAREGQTTDRPDCFFFTKCGCCGARGDIKSATIKLCAKCKAVAYCGKECQVRHWKMGHKIDCATVEKVKTDMKDQRMLQSLESR
jgi:MYND finger